jgi:energy-converting hydrogenase Eha subunit H
MTFLRDRAICAQRDFVSGFCSSPRHENVSEVSYQWGLTAEIAVYPSFQSASATRELIRSA